MEFISQRIIPTLRIIKPFDVKNLSRKFDPLLEVKTALYNHCQIHLSFSVMFCIHKKYNTKDGIIMNRVKNICYIWLLTPYQIKNTFWIIFCHPIKSAYVPEITSTHIRVHCYIGKIYYPQGVFYVLKILKLAA